MPLDEVAKPRSFDDFELRLGDIMRGERATLGKSLLDVQRELRINANYIAAIENCDPSSFDTPGFIAGYVRSYARYLGMDPDETFALFCEESGFSVAHGMSEAASGVKRKSNQPIVAASAVRDPFTQPSLPFQPGGDGLMSRIEPAAIGSTLVLIALVAGIGYGGWSVLQEVQRVRLAPVEQTPVVLSDLDPISTATRTPTPDESLPTEQAGVFTPPSNEALDRLYRPQALDVPVLVARDAPISTLDPSRVGLYARRSAESRLPQVDGVSGEPGTQLAGVDHALRAALGDETTEIAQGEPGAPQVLEQQAPGVTMIAVRPAWVRVRAADGSVIYEGIMNAGDTYAVPQTEDAPTLRVGESGAIYFAMNGQTFGPAGPRGQVTSNLALSVNALSESFSVAELEQDSDLARVVAELNAAEAPAVE
ncbi:helix-turn-helix domain-containing protein [Litorisediminicola beolgyonensis]|uniref:Helix-turn-helix domain-containing protein n=1 Tax=Litorisediminicola beolgyonensis TaxID=1173614 RepID=A0ABW3ZFG3_9RHOB